MRFHQPRWSLYFYSMIQMELILLIHLYHTISLHIYSRAAETRPLAGNFEEDEGLYENPASSSSSRFKFTDVFAPKGGELLFSSLFAIALALLYVLLALLLC